MNECPNLLGFTDKLKNICAISARVIPEFALNVWSVNPCTYLNALFITGSLVGISEVVGGVGCGRTLDDEAHDQARDAFATGDFSRGSLLLAAGCETLHSQSIYLLHMIHYQSSEDMARAMVAWSNIRALDARYDFIEVVANDLMQEFVHTARSENGDKSLLQHLFN